MMNARILINMVCVAVLAIGLYLVKYSVQDVQRNVASLKVELATEKESLHLLNAEWAYLNRPDRLRELTTINFDRLGLLPLEPSQFGAAQDVTYPLPPIHPVTDTMDVSGLSTVAPAFDPDQEPFP